MRSHDDCRTTIVSAKPLCAGDGQLALEYTLPEPVSGKIGLWSKTDSTSYFKDYLVEPLEFRGALIIALIARSDRLIGDAKKRARMGKSLQPGLHWL